MSASLFPTSTGAALRAHSDPRCERCGLALSLHFDGHAVGIQVDCNPYATVTPPTRHCVSQECREPMIDTSLGLCSRHLSLLASQLSNFNPRDRRRRVNGDMPY